MINYIKNLFGLGTEVNYLDLVKQGAIILDVRTKNEYTGGHIRGSMNISVDALKNRLGKLQNKDTAIITCCATGMRSATAKRILKSNGYSSVYNGGGWQSLRNKIK